MYSPKVKEELVVKLYRHKLKYPENKPMTWFVNKAVEEYLNKYGGPDASCPRLVLRPQERRTNSINRPINQKQGG